MRWAHGFLPEEVVNKPDIKSMIVEDIRKIKEGKFLLHHIVNAEALVNVTIEDLKTKDQIKRSIAQILYYYNRPDLKKYHFITLASELKNILIVILKDSTFLEFYSPTEHTKIHSAVQIKSRAIARDFAKWFDAYSKEKHEPEKDYQLFKKEILKYARELAKISPSEIEKAIKEVKPIYG
jgi:ribosomal protein L29